MTAAIGLTAVAVMGSEPVSTGAAALDLARAEARHRRVLIVDLIGDAPPLRAVVATDDPHGVSDAFAYGISFGVITRNTTVHPNVSIIPSGTDAIPFATVLPSPRWTHLIEQVQARGELVVFAVLSSTPAIGSLTDRVDCVIAAPSRLHEVLEAVLAAATTPEDEHAAGGAPAATPAPKPPRRPVVPTPAPSRFSFRNRSFTATIGALAAVLVIGFGWVALRGRGPDTGSRGTAVASRTPDRADTETSSAQLAAGADSTAASAGASEATAAAEAAAADSAPGGVSSLDSSTGATYAVRVATYPTFVEALRELRKLRPGHPAVTIAPIVHSTEPGSKKPPTPVFALMVGAAHTMPPLDTVVAHWPFHSGFAPSIVVHAPFALLLSTGLPLDSARRLSANLVGRGVPAYVLATPAGGSRVYAGAFDSADQAAPLATSLRAIGLAPVVAYRIGYAP